MNNVPERKLWLSVLELAGKDAFGAYDPYLNYEENKIQADKKFKAYFSNKKGKRKLVFPVQFCKPHSEAISARSWFKGGRKDYREVVENAGFEPEGLRKEILVKIKWIEELEKHFYDLYYERRTEKPNKGGRVKDCNIYDDEVQ